MGARCVQRMHAGRQLVYGMLAGMHAQGCQDTASSGLQGCMPSTPQNHMPQFAHTELLTATFSSPALGTAAAS